jgi:hypothetical protein
MVVLSRAVGHGLSCTNLTSADNVRTVVDGVMERLGPALLDRFESSKGYRIFDDTLPTRMSLHQDTKTS